MYLVEFLRARLDEAAEAIARQESVHEYEGKELVYRDSDGEWVAFPWFDTGWQRRDVDSKRQIIDAELERLRHFAAQSSAVLGVKFDAFTYPWKWSPVLRALAAVYADHPDYQEHWKP